MASGLIYLIIIGMWVAYFLPRWMRQHDTQSGRESERYKSAMKIVASTPNFPDLINPEERSKALKIRRLVLGALTLVLAGTALASALSYVPLLSILIPLTALCIYIINVRRQVVAANIKKRRLAALAAIPLAKLGTPQDVANLCLFLAADESSYITGQVVTIDGGMVMA